MMRERQSEKPSNTLIRLIVESSILSSLLRHLLNLDVFSVRRKSRLYSINTILIEVENFVMMSFVV